MLRPFAPVLAFTATFVCAAMTACGEDRAGESAFPDSSADAAVIVANDRESTQSGRIIRAQTENEGVPGATVTIGTRSTTTNEDGDYELIVPRNTPYRMTVTAPEYFKLIEQETILKKETLDRGNTNLLPTATATFLASLLPGRNPEKGLVVVKVNPQAPCVSEEGATIAVEPSGDAGVAYFGGALPDSSRTTVMAGTTLSAAIYNVEVSVPLTIKVTSPTCAQAPFPIDDGDVTYTGSQIVEAGDAISYIRVYIRDPVVLDAGAD